jgi:hypothetical protein
MLADLWIKSNQLFFGTSLRDGIVTREEIEFYLFVLYGYGRGWHGEYIKKLPTGLEPVCAYDNLGFVCVADVLGKTPEKIESKWHGIADKTNKHFNTRSQRKK